MENAKKIMQVLLSADHKAYIVGGAVRDTILRRRIDDIDIATDAIPEEIMYLASKEGWSCLLVGEAFGVTIVKIGSCSYEVATFRCEGYGKDSHRPEWVDFAASIEEDLARRDFTMNALAMDIDGRITDPFGGQEDMARGIIRAVGDAKRRFTEDGLRIWRAVRFAAQLEFAIEETTWAAMKCCYRRCAGLSVERVAIEIDKILLSIRPDTGLKAAKDCGILGMSVGLRDKENGTDILPEVVALYGLEQNERYHLFDVWGHTMAVIKSIPDNLLLRWAALLHDVAKGSAGVRALNKRGEISDIGHEAVGAIMAEDILRRLRKPSKLIREVVWLVENHMGMPALKRKSVLKWLRKLALTCNADNFSQRIEWLWQLKRADQQAGRVLTDTDGIRETIKMAEEYLSSLPFFAKQLDINGDEILKLTSCAPKEIPLVQKELLLLVQDGQLRNEKSEMVSYLQRNGGWGRK